MPPVPGSDDKSALDSLQDRLYAPKGENGVQVDLYRTQEAPKPYGWTPPPPPIPEPPQKHLSRSAKFGIAAAIFFVLCGAVAAFLIWQGNRAISSDRIDIRVTPEISIASGDTVPLVVTVTNDNPTEIFNTVLFVDLPPGTRDANDPSIVREQYSDSLGMIESGGSVTRTIPVQLFGSQGQALTLPIRLEYRVPDSNALLVARAEHEVTVSSSPIAVSIAGAAQSTSGDPLTLSITVRSNAAAPLSDVALKAAFPPGFSLTSSDPQSLTDGLIPIGDIAPGGERTVRVTGVLVGEAGEEKVFRFSAGSKNPDGTNTLAATFAEGAASVSLSKPTVALSLSLNRESEETIAVAPGQSILGIIGWENAGSRELSNVQVEVSFSGNGLDVAGITAGSGFYRSNDRTVVFSRDTDAGLGRLSAGNTGTGSFGLRAKSAAALAGTTQPTITVTARVRGVRDGQTVELSPMVTRTIRVGTNVSLSSAAQRASGSPEPAPGVETSYQVTLMAKNALNSVGGARVTATLPQYVRFGGAIGAANISFDEATRTVTWNVGDLIANASASASFSASILPSESQKGTSPVLVGPQSFSGTDRFTGPVSASAPAVTVSVP